MGWLAPSRVGSRSNHEGARPAPFFQEAIMIVAFIIGFLLGAGAASGAIYECFKLKTKEQWEEDELALATAQSNVYRLTVENARLRVALAAGEMTEAGKKVAAMTMAALETVIKDELERKEVILITDEDI